MKHVLAHLVMCYARAMREWQESPNATRAAIMADHYVRMYEQARQELEDSAKQPFEMEFLRYFREQAN